MSRFAYLHSRVQFFGLHVSDIHTLYQFQCLSYMQANDAYLSMAIGNAPWPIGVTMVGIHARTGREKIFSQQIAHVLNDETQRKYIQVCVYMC